MAKLTFFSVLKNNLQCALCKKENCPIKYMPESNIFHFYDGTRYITKCEKDEKAREDAILKRRIP